MIQKNSPKKIFQQVQRCGRHLSLDEKNEILSEYIKEYDLEIDESNDAKGNSKIAEKIELELSGKKVVTTGLSIEDERGVQEQVESRGGEYKPKFYRVAWLPDLQSGLWSWNSKVH